MEAEDVRARREAAGLTVAQVAAAAGCAESTVRRVEAGVRVKRSTMLAIEAALRGSAPPAGPPGELDDIARLVRVLVGLPPAVRRPAIELLEALRPGFEGLDDGARRLRAA